ncbi:MAG: mycothiol synthase [Propionibacteriaceae bacterium]|jgi:mycothiol synthase|nr:mycothiol synthase [Propionibacteriaceae bacterium]
MAKTSAKIRRQIIGLAERAQAHDGGSFPLNEEAILALEAEDLAPKPKVLQFMVNDENQNLVGYLQWNRAFDTAQIVVDPKFRRRGVAKHLLDGVSKVIGHFPPVWAFGDSLNAQRFAIAQDMRPMRSLLAMKRGLPLSVAPISFDLTIRGFQPGDEEAVLELNRQAFAAHPEQGSLDLAGLRARMAEGWFDPGGLLLGFDDAGLAAFHWTKRQSPQTGEVYVLAVAPRAQRHGYGKVMLAAGLDYLAAGGCTSVILYVDGEENAPLALYTGIGFSIVHKDVLYARRG